MEQSTLELSPPTRLQLKLRQRWTDTYHEEFFHYAYYFGDDAARVYYGAWSPHPGTPNPCGINPNGITPAPAPAHDDPVQQAPAPAVTSHVSAPVATTMPANVRDLGLRRGVLNLPAWMTK